MNTSTIESLPDIDDCPPFSPEDEACFSELREVLKRHNRLSRFGVMLLHQHFTTREDEILMEYCDEAERTLTIKPVHRAELSPKSFRETNWRLDSMSSVGNCIQVCPHVGDSGTHTGRSHHL